MATTLLALGRLDEAEELLQTVVERRRSSLGDEHPDTRAAVADLEAMHQRRRPRSA
jgi:Tetratricopeptide repeat